MGNKFTGKEFIERIELFFPEWNFEVLEFNGYKKPAKIKCLNCGKIISLEKASYLSRKINICSCYKKFTDYHDKLKYLGEKCDFEILYDGSAQEKKRIKCKKCGCIMERSLVSLLNTPQHCDNCHKYREGQFHYSKEEVQKRLDENFNKEYELLQYQGMTKSALLRHLNCGYIFKIREIGDLFEGRNRGCPKCYQFKSLGEQKIRNFLDKENINYIPQKTFSPLNKSKYRFDFYLPDFNLAIEYQGEQHFRDNAFFKEDLSTTQKRDEIKRKYCKENNIELLEIKYTKLKEIDTILSSKFNDYRKDKTE
jgi:hypothetical protein